MGEPRNYVHGHSRATVSAHARRSAKRFTSYVLPYIQPHHAVLDVGCGPGTISADFAELAPSGSVTCLDASEAVLASARATCTERGLSNVDFVTGDVNKLPFDDGTFDVVHAHQVVIHLPEPETAMREMFRVLKQGGVLACKDMILSSMAYHPCLSGMDAWHRALVATMRAAGADPDMGARLKGLALAAGFAARDVKCSVGPWCFSEPDDVAWWGESVAERLTEEGGLRGKALGTGAMSADELDEGARAWEQWARTDEAWFGVMNGEVICVKS
ncbi:hypothetical protein VUR80DRAFT_5078 [Thermomyces stellatus]